MYLALLLPTALAGLCKATLSADITFIGPEQLFKDGEGEDCQCGSQDYKYQFDLGGKLMQTNGQLSSSRCTVLFQPARLEL